jgi:hypothetical protein
VECVRSLESCPDARQMDYRRVAKPTLFLIIPTSRWFPFFGTPIGVPSCSTSHDSSRPEPPAFQLDLGRLLIKGTILFYFFGN